MKATPSVDVGGTSSEVWTDENAFWQPLALVAAEADTAEALDRVLTVLGPLYRADRVWVGRYNAELTHFWGASDWVGPGIVSHFHQIQGVSVNVITDAHRKFTKGEMVLIPDVERLPRQARSLQAELRREGVRSTFAYPLMHEDRLIGFFGFDYVRDIAAWKPGDLDRLPALARFLAVILQRRLAVVPTAEVPAAVAVPGTIYVTKRGGMKALPLDEVVFFEADGDYSRVHMSDGGEHFERRSLRTWIAQLPRERFLRVHQRYVVNGARIAKLKRGARWTLTLQDVDDEIPVGRVFRHALRLHIGF